MQSTTKIEIVVIHYGELVHIVTGFLGSMNAEWKIDRKQFESYVDAQGKRGWSIGFSNGQGSAQLHGKMDWDEYYSDIRTLEADAAEFIAAKKIKASLFIKH